MLPPLNSIEHSLQFVLCERRRLPPVDTTAAQVHQKLAALSLSDAGVAAREKRLELLGERISAPPPVRALINGATTLCTYARSVIDFPG